MSSQSVGKLKNKFIEFEEKAKNVVSSYSKQTRDVCCEELEKKKSQIESGFEERIIDVQTELEHEISDNVEAIHKDMDKMNKLLEEVKYKKDAKEKAEQDLYQQQTEVLKQLLDTQQRRSFGPPHPEVGIRMHRRY
eukprot:TRINITY_DN142573_c0_g1_i1.p2 TRINITY_DN142573_c0_g1~~TRINITY_DN142573_c0_g1_i1.p2  ORF type:complete len:136 (-),score=30.54 TRINITY_DN142573_c0_g1_i1:14-421(-)